MSDFDMDDSFDIEFTGNASAARELKDGKYIVSVKKIEKKVQKKGKFEGANTLEWRMRIAEGELRGLEMIVTTYLNAELGWTTDRIMSAIYPAILKGARIKPSEFIDRKLELVIEVRKNAETKQVSIYPNVKAAYPFVDLGSTTGSAFGPGSFDEVG